MDNIKCNKCGKLIKYDKSYKVINKKFKEYGDSLCFKCAIKWTKSNLGYRKAIKLIFNKVKYIIKDTKIYQTISYLTPYIVGYGYLSLCCIHFIINKDLIGLSLLLVFIIQSIS